MKLVSKPDYQIALAQYIRGFCDWLSNPSAQPNASGAGPRYYMEGHQDARLSPRQSLANDDHPFGYLKDEDEGAAGKAYVTLLRKAAASVSIEVGQNGSDQVQRLMAVIGAAGAAELGKVEARSKALAFVDALDSHPEAVVKLVEAFGQHPEALDALLDSRERR